MFTYSHAFAQVSVVLKAMDGTTKLLGTSTVPGHLNEIDLWSYSQGESNCIGCGKVQLSDLSVMMSLNAANINFKSLILNGKKLTSVDLTYIKPGAAPVEYYKIHMENVTVSSFQESGSSENPTVSVSFAPGQVAWQYTVINPDGTAGAKTSYGWDVGLNAVWNYKFK